LKEFSELHPRAKLTAYLILAFGFIWIISAALIGNLIVGVVALNIFIAVLYHRSRLFIHDKKIKKGSKVYVKHLTKTWEGTPFANGYYGIVTDIAFKFDYVSYQVDLSCNTQIDKIFFTAGNTHDYTEYYDGYDGKSSIEIRAVSDEEFTVGLLS
jgi:hypothetical protein